MLAWKVAIFRLLNHRKFLKTRFVGLQSAEKRPLLFRGYCGQGVAEAKGYLKNQTCAEQAPG